MENVSFDCDSVISMEEMGIGVEEILQYARAVLPQREVRALFRGLEGLLTKTPVVNAFTEEFAEEAVKAVADAVSDHCL